MNPGRRGGKPATNRLSYGAAFRENIGCKPHNMGTDKIFFPRGEPENLRIKLGLRRIKLLHFGETECKVIEWIIPV
jgi:hypothetical protein